MEIPRRFRTAQALGGVGGVRRQKSAGRWPLQKEWLPSHSHETHEIHQKETLQPPSRVSWLKVLIATSKELACATYPFGISVFIRPSDFGPRISAAFFQRACPW